MSTTTPPAPALDDAVLVEQSLAGDRHAFGLIVARYQSLVCGLAYSATGSRSHSEDLAQETFVAAWRKLPDLRDASRLCGWLCGIARNVIHGDLRRLGRQPAHCADALDVTAELASAEPLPTEQAVSNEEMAILWREVSRLPESYREPLILFYRDHRSVEHVATALGLTPDAVMQRLTRGRRLLHERMMAFVESTLQRTNPGPQFTLQVQAALPILTTIGPLMAAGTATKGGAAAKSGLLAGFGAALAPFIGLLAAAGMSWAEIAQARSLRERRLVVRWTILLWLSTAAFVATLPTVAWWAHRAGVTQREDWRATAPMVAVWFVFSMAAVTLVVLMLRGKAALQRQMLQEASSALADAPPPSLQRRIATTVGFLVAVFWSLVFLAWRTGDRPVALALAAGVVLLGAAPFALQRGRAWPADEARAGGWYVSFCALVFLVVLNWRLDVWMAPVYGVDLATMHRLLPPGLIHWLSAIAVAWTTTLVLLTRPARSS
jgi:RNA polymerase sigma factor (sigma-70 family)